MPQSKKLRAIKSPDKSFIIVRRLCFFNFTLYQIFQTATQCVETLIQMKTLAKITQMTLQDYEFYPKYSCILSRIYSNKAI